MEIYCTSIDLPQAVKPPLGKWYTTPLTLTFEICGIVTDFELSELTERLSKEFMERNSISPDSISLKPKP